MEKGIYLVARCLGCLGWVVWLVRLAWDGLVGSLCLVGLDDGLIGSPCFGWFGWFTLGGWFDWVGLVV